MPETMPPAVVSPVGGRERAYFDELVRTRGDFNPFADRGWRTLARRFEAWVAPERPLEVLDIGCGTGQSRQLYARHAARYVGVDLSGAAVAVARGRFPESEW